MFFKRSVNIYFGKSLNKSKKYKKININSSKKKIWDQIRNELFGECIYEWCWIDQKDLIKNTK